MDIDMPEMDGFDTIVNYKAEYSESIIIILTTHLDCARKGYLVDAFRYLDKTKKDERSYLFAVPEGGWSTITVRISYTEKQVKHDAQNKWWRRELFYAYKTEYATERPYMRILNNIEHRDGNGKLIHKFEKWTPVTSMADAKWDYFKLSRNGKNMYYSPTTKNSASVSYLVFCNGGILVNDNKAGHTIRMGLNTK